MASESSKTNSQLVGTGSHRPLQPGRTLQEQAEYLPPETKSNIEGLERTFKAHMELFQWAKEELERRINVLEMLSIPHEITIAVTLKKKLEESRDKPMSQMLDTLDKTAACFDSLLTVFR